MGTTVKSLYDTDFVEWTAHTADLLRQGRFADVDLANLIEEIESLGRNDQKAVRSQLLRMLKHLVKHRIQPERAGESWRQSIVTARSDIQDGLEDSPSLRRHLEAAMERTYQRAIKDAVDETRLTARRATLPIPEHCPYTLSDLLDSDLDTLLRKLP